MARLRIHACCHPTANKFEVKPCPFILRRNTRAQFGPEKRRATKEGDKKNNSQWSRVHYSCHFERTGMSCEYKWSGKILPFEWHFLWPIAQIIRTMCHFSEIPFFPFLRMRKKLLILIAWYSAAGVVRCHGNDNNNEIVSTAALRMRSCSIIPVLFSLPAQLCAFFHFSSACTNAYICWLLDPNSSRYLTTFHGGTYSVHIWMECRIWTGLAYALSTDSRATWSAHTTHRVTEWVRTTTDSATRTASTFINIIFRAAVIFYRNSQQYFRPFGRELLLAFLWVFRLCRDNGLFTTYIFFSLLTRFHFFSYLSLCLFRCIVSLLIPVRCHFHISHCSFGSFISISSECVSGFPNNSVHPSVRPSIG